MPFAPGGSSTALRLHAEPLIVIDGATIVAVGYGGAPPADAESAVREHVERGVQVIKLVASDGHLTPGTRQEQAHFTPAELSAAVDEAHRLGLSVTAHVHGTQAIVDALAAGVDGLEHVTFWTQDGVDAPATVIAEIGARRIIVGASAGMPPVPGAELDPRSPSDCRTSSPTCFACARPARRSSPAPTQAPARSSQTTLHAVPQMVFLGLTPLQGPALRDLARGRGLRPRASQRAPRPGYDADILAVDGDPLTDPTAIHNIEAVHARGIAVR